MPGEEDKDRELQNELMQFLKEQEKKPADSSTPSETPPTPPKEPTKEGKQDSHLSQIGETKVANSLTLAEIERALGQMQKETREERVVAATEKIREMFIRLRDEAQGDKKTLDYITSRQMGLEVLSGSVIQQIKESRKVSGGKHAKGRADKRKTRARGRYVGSDGNRAFSDAQLRGWQAEEDWINIPEERAKYYEELQKIFDENKFKELNDKQQFDVFVRLRATERAILDNFQERKGKSQGKITEMSEQEKQELEKIRDWMRGINPERYKLYSAASEKEEKKEKGFIGGEKHPAEPTKSDIAEKPKVKIETKQEKDIKEAKAIIVDALAKAYGRSATHRDKEKFDNAVVFLREHIRSVDDYDLGRRINEQVSEFNREYEVTQKLDAERTRPVSKNELQKLEDEFQRLVETAKNISVPVTGYEKDHFRVLYERLRNYYTTHDDKWDMLPGLRNKGKQFWEAAEKPRNYATKRQREDAEEEFFSSAQSPDIDDVREARKVWNEKSLLDIYDQNYDVLAQWEEKIIRGEIDDKSLAEFDGLKFDYPDPNSTVNAGYDIDRQVIEKNEEMKKEFQRAKKELRGKIQKILKGEEVEKPAATAAEKTEEEKNIEDLTRDAEQEVERMYASYPKGKIEALKKIIVPQMVKEILEMIKKGSNNG